MRKTPAADVVIAKYRELGSVWKTGEALGISGQTVQRICSRAGESSNRRFVTEYEKELLCATYRIRVEAGELSLLASEMGRSVTTICTYARKLGLTDAQSAREYAAKKSASALTGKSKWSDRPHPRGFRGKKHSLEAKAIMVEAVKRGNRERTPEAEDSRVRKAMKTKVERYGTVAPNVKRGSWKAAWREIGGVRKFYRSRWEANYARYLNWLQSRGDILDWKHEPETFWFEKIRRGSRSYLPDFRVWELDQSSKLHEVKGWMDSRSKTKLRRMRIYHPQETIVLVGKPQYLEIEARLGRLVEGWEWC